MFVWVSDELWGESQRHLKQLEADERADYELRFDIFHHTGDVFGRRQAFRQWRAAGQTSRLSCPCCQNKIKRAKRVLRPCK
jgi:hypothetical protein